MKRIRLAGVAWLGLVLVGGCSSAPVEAEATLAAQVFASAQGEQACALLTPDTRAALERRERRDCASALDALALPHGTSALGASVAGSAALVQLPEQAIFLARFPDGWLVTAAGCRRPSPDPSDPYECEVEP